MHQHLRNPLSHGVKFFCCVSVSLARHMPSSSSQRCFLGAAQLCCTSSQARINFSAM